MIWRGTIWSEEEERRDDLKRHNLVFKSAIKERRTIWMWGRRSETRVLKTRFPLGTWVLDTRDASFQHCFKTCQLTKFFNIQCYLEIKFLLWRNKERKKRKKEAERIKKILEKEREKVVKERKRKTKNIGKKEEQSTSHRSPHLFKFQNNLSFKSSSFPIRVHVLEF